MTATTAAPPATYSVAAACRRLRISPAAFRRGWAGVFSAVPGSRRVPRDECEHAAQYAGDRTAMIRAALR